MNSYPRTTSRMYQGACVVCGSTFTAGYAYALYCSPSCRQMAYRERIRTRQPLPLAQPKKPQQLQLSAVSPVSIDVRAYQGTPIQRRESDGWVNATAMCQAGGKRWNNYERSNRTREYVAALCDALAAENPSSTVDALNRATVPAVTEVVKGGDASLQGTWIHPRLAVDLARWISPAFAVWMDGWFLESLTKPQQAQPAPTLAPGVHVVADTMNDARRMFSAAVRTELIATLNLCDRDLFGTTDLPVPRFHYHLGAGSAAVRSA